MTESEKRKRRKLYDARWKAKNPDYKAPYNPDKARAAYLKNRERRLAQANERYKNMTPEQREEHNRKRRERHAKNPEVRNKVERKRDHQKRAGGAFNTAIWNIVRLKYKNSCIYCGVKGKMTVEHRKPVSLGGDNSFGNLAPACLSCNSGKRNKNEEEYRQWRKKQGLYVAPLLEIDYYFLY